MPSPTESRAREASSVAAHSFECERDPRDRTRNVYRIEGDTPEIVQSVMDQVQADGRFSVVEFIGPLLTDSGRWGALGQSFLRMEVSHAA